MPLISVDALAGYLLEEVLAHLLKHNGYRLLRAQSDDPVALIDAGHGLLVRGRGAEHQADALGELLTPTPFSLPVRLFVEGKNRRSKVTLAEVRNAHGVITDVNEHYATEQAKDWPQPLRRYQYRYALFSTAGFKREAQGYALAQQISLVDLSGPAFAPLVTSVRRAAETVHAQAVAAGLARFPVRQVRLALREAFEALDAGTGSLAEPAPGPLPHGQLASWAARFTADLTGSAAGEGLILGFPPAPFVLAMRPASMSRLEEYVAAHGPDIKVSIGFARRAGVAGDWTVTPTDHPDAFRLSFGLPGALERWLLSAPEDARARALQAKHELLYSISIFLEDRLVRLQFSPVEAPLLPREELRDYDAYAEDDDGPGETGQLTGEATDATDTSLLRQMLRAPEPFEDDDEPPLPEPVPPDGQAPGWTSATVERLMLALDRRGYVQAELIREAARRGGVLEREDVYRVAEFARDRTLRGLTRPPTRITGQLKDARALAEDAPYPFRTQYASGVRASHFEVPAEVVAALRALGPLTGI